MAERRRLGKYAQRRGAQSIAETRASFAPGAAACGAEVLQITGTTVTGNAATLTVTEAGFDFDGRRIYGTARIRRADGKLAKLRALCAAAVNQRSEGKSEARGAKARRARKTRALPRSARQVRRAAARA